MPKEGLKSRYIAIALACTAAAFAAWQTPINLGATLNTGANEWYPFLSRDGSFMLFVSDRPGGHGGWDLWRSTDSE
ncbi:MAG: hypothetical protein GTN49_02370 [candidate division Zixibacteria bacterium]|nr:hypothetical protein [candidate division Zixibacteria bacterium]